MAKKHILVVEDEESLLRLQTILLTARGYDVTGVADGVDALATIDRVKPDLVLLDIMLPGVDGFEVCRHIKEHPGCQNVPVVMLTAKRSEEDRKRGLSIGASAYITKPFRSSQLLSTVEQLLEASSTQ